MKIVLATRNPGKAREVAACLEGLPVRLQTLDEAGVAAEEAAANVKEDGATYAENALIKARAAANATGLPALADDSGIEVDALPGELGIRSARFGGAGLDDAGRNRLLLERLSGVEAGRRGARFRCALAFCRPGGAHQLFEGTLEGRILESGQGAGGFGYDPLLFLQEMGCAVAELDMETKNKISHRGRALAAFRAWLKKELEKAS